MSEMERLLHLCGIPGDYLDYGGERRQVPWQHRLRALRIMGYEAEDRDAVAAAVDQLAAEPWRHWLQSGYVTSIAAPLVTLHCTAAQLTALLAWELQLETGATINGQCLPAELPEVGNYMADSERYSARQLPLPALPPGYHTLHVVDCQRQETATVMACPERFYGGETESVARMWGVSCQLYTLRSARNWGVGDFTDLMELLALAATAGADLVGLNPLHAPCSGRNDAASPYSPSDRRFLNPLYIDPEQEPEWQLIAPQLVTAAWQQQRDQLQAAPLVDYEGVNILKYAAFESLYSAFCHQQLAQDTARGKAFREFQANGGETLEGFAHYEASHNVWAWRYRENTGFFAWLQWLAAEQLKRCQQRADQLGMRLGLMQDLAVGALGQGCEVQQSDALYLAQASIGAPPDPFAPNGQDWGLPVPHPQRLRQQGFRFFTDLLRHNMASSGALRIDHVMGLMRLWWCLHDTEDPAGLYIYYPWDDLLALLRLESWRNECVVIGEDMGVVPEEFRIAMRQGGMLGNRLFYFEQHPDGRFHAPEEQPADVLLMVTNHDVPTLADWWQGSDLQRRYDLGLTTDPAVLAQQQQQRQIDREQLQYWLADAGLLPPDVGPTFDMALCQAIHQGCARSQARLLLLQLEDLQLLAEPVNIPGTCREYPNWRRKQVMESARLFADTSIQALLGAVDKERKQ